VLALEGDGLDPDPLVPAEVVVAAGVLELDPLTALLALLPHPPSRTTVNAPAVPSIATRAKPPRAQLLVTAFMISCTNVSCPERLSSRRSLSTTQSRRTPS
jgi:hypothetical protein